MSTDTAPDSSSEKSKKGNFHTWLTGSFAWLTGGAFLTIIGGIVTGSFNTLILPSYVPALDVVTSVSTTSPNAKMVYKPTNGSKASEYRPLELTVTVKNPGSKKLYLLKAMWVAEACSILDSPDEDDTNNRRKGGPTVALDTEPSGNFQSRVKHAHQVYTTGNDQVYRGYTRSCSFIGTGPMLTTDSAVNSQETINTQIIIVYPIQISAFKGDNDMVDVDFVRITTYVPSSKSKDLNVRAILVFDKGEDKPPGQNLQIMRKINFGASNDTEAEILESAHNKNLFCEVETIKLGGPEENSGRERQAWCDVSTSEQQKLGIVLTNTVTETWLRDRLEKES